MGSLLRSRRALGLVIAALLVAAGCGPEYPACDTDGDCRDGEFCVNGQCQQCRNDGDCGPGRRCAEGACEDIAGYCDAEHPCPGGTECVESRCRAIASAETDSCAAVTCLTGQRCEGGRCIDDGPPPCTMTPIYFEYDSDVLDAEDRASLEADARCSRELHATTVHLTGHADERGTEEYNLILSERRAQAALRYLRGLGVSVPLSASGMGEEMASGTDEASFVRDRRVDVHPR